MRKKPSRRSSDVVLVVVALALGAAAALGYAAYRAASTESGRGGAFGDAMLFPGTLIIAAVAAMVWLGWKANID